MGIMMERHSLLVCLREFAKKKPVWGVCAGSILLANRIQNIQQLGTN